MKVLLHGCNGRMGGAMTRLIAKAADAVVSCGVDTGRSVDGVLRAYPVHRTFAAVTEEADVVIDFSHAWSLGQLVGYCVSRRIPLVTGTTGLTAEDKLLLHHASEVIPVLSAANMSFGASAVHSLAIANALRAARFLCGRPPGHYGMEDLIRMPDLSLAGAGEANSD